MRAAWVCHGLARWTVAPDAPPDSKPAPVRLTPDTALTGRVVLLVHGLDAAEGEGFQFEAMHVAECLRAGKTESEILPLDLETGFFYAEPYHQQYLAKNPNGYCGVGGTGVSCPIGLAT